MEEDRDITTHYYTVTVVCQNCGEIAEKELAISTDGTLDVDDYVPEKTTEEDDPDEE